MPRHRSTIMMPGHRAGVPNKYKGKTFRSEILTKPEVRALIEENNCGLSGLRDRAEIATGWGTGARVSELLALRPSDVDLKSGAVRINGTKTRNAVRTVGLNPYCRAILRDWMDVRADELDLTPGSPIFCCISKWEIGHQVKPAQFRQKLKLLARHAGIDKRVYPHSLRHTFAVELYRAGVSILLISKALGHSNIAVTYIYLNHVDPTEIVDATNGLQLGDGTIQVPGMTDYWGKRAGLESVPVNEW